MAELASKEIDDSQIAIIGMAGRFPGAKSIDAFWNNLRDGVESVTFFTDEQLKASGVDPEALNNPNYVKARPVLKDVELFDAAFFGFSPREAGAIDPQHRLFLECVWEAIETAGYDAESYKGAISLYGGVSMSSYLVNNLYANPEALALAGEYPSFLSNFPDSLTTRIAYKLNLKGACYTVQTFCSTSLVAVHMACQSLLNFECDMAVAGGVTVFVPQNAGYWYQEGLIVSPDGHCRPFDAKAQGTVFGNGLGAVVLKRLEDALTDGDHIDAAIMGSATNNDGSLKVSYTAPSVAGQAEVIVEALADADVEPETINYVETHGTGTALGDPTEVTALTRAFRSRTQKKGFCAIGSVKSNIGHLDAAGGVAGLIKAVLALKHTEIPPSLHFEKPNPNIDFENSPFYVNSRLSEWKSDGTPRRAGVSAFGVGGTNAHVIVEEAPVLESSSASRPHQLLVLSAKTSSALETATKNLIAYFKEYPEVKLPDVTYTLQVGRKAFSHRRMIVCQNIDDAVLTLEAADPKRVFTVYQEKRNPPIVFMFSGQGAQYVNMGLELYRTESPFQEQIDRCSDILKPHLGLDLRDILYPAEENVEEAAQKLKQTFITQPALFVIEYALAKLWMSWGVHPEALVGHSIGEYVAACLAGVFSLEDALSLVATRGRLIQELPRGSMLAVFLSEKQIRPFLSENVSLAAVNGPSICAVSGDKEAIKDLEEQLSKKNVDCRHLHTSHAFHSKMVEPILDAFAEQVKQVRLNPPQIPFLSNVIGTWITSDEAMDPSYWARHLRQTVRFSDCIQELLKEPNRVLLELGPGQTLSTLARQHSNRPKEQTVLSSIRHPKEEKSDVAFILNTLGRLWLAGIEVNWSGFYKDERRYRLPLPTYPFERQRYWVEPLQQPQGVHASQAGLAKMEDNSQPLTRQEVQSDYLPARRAEVQSDYLAPRNPELQSDYVAPRNQVEQTIADIWQKLLGVEQIGIYDNFFDLGGSSILAGLLFAKIEEIFDKKLPLATLFEAPTVEQLATILGKEEWSAPWSPLLAIQPDGSKPPFFCIHGAGGNILIYRDLARHLGTDQPFYGLQAQGLDGERPFLTRIEDMAAHYIKEIQTVQAEGPYFLGGYCMGGTVALEMAQQLHAQGQKVALLALLETYNWANLPAMSFLDDVYYYAQKIEFHWRNFLLLKSKEKLTFIQEKAKVAKSRKKIWFESIKSKLSHNFNQGSEQQLSLSQFWETNDRAALNYVPKPYPGRITQFRPVKEYGRYHGPELGWHKLAAGGVEIHELPVYPAGMLVEPFVRLLAKKLKACIHKALETEPSNKI
jgi:acyl transferase domain-containing protein/thioesterase domain-containing protein